MTPRLLFACASAALAASASAGPVITEFLASNHGPSFDDFGESSDWIEITNADESAQVLTGWSLSDEPYLPKKWVFPAVTLEPGEVLLVRASGRDLRTAGQTLHTNFTLAAEGEFLGLYPPVGPCASCWQPYPKQFSGISYGTAGNTGGYFTSPSPGLLNDLPVLADYARDTKFSVNRGFFAAPFQVAVTTETPQAQIRYTLNGDVPTADTGTVYTGPINITSTTVLRARAFRDGWLPSNTDTQTYIFPQTWKTQADFPAGFSETWGMFDANAKVLADYGMNTAVTNNAVYGPLLIPAMTQTLPVVCVNGSVAEIFGDDGIHGNLRKTDAEVPVSVEYFNPAAPAEAWSARAALQAHGGAVRDFAKKAFRIDFTGPFSDGALQFPLFPGSPAERFDQLVLRGGGHDSFTVRTRGGNPDKNDHPFHASYLRDQFLRGTENAMGLLSPRGRYVHLCLNGLYWGLYDLHERPNAEFCADHGGGEPSEWDVLHHGPQLIDGTDEQWSQLQSLASFGISTQAEYETLAALAGPDAFIDHLLVRMWAADHDWLGPAFLAPATANVAIYQNKNWYGVRRSRGSAPGPWQFFTWDAEISMGNHLLFRWFDSPPGGTTPDGLEFPKFQELHLDMTGIAQPGTPAAVWNALSQWPEFRLRVADRARKLFFHTGALSPASAAARVESMRQQLDLPMVAESARWGAVSGFGFAFRGNTLVRNWDNGLLTRDTHWRPEVAWLRDTWSTQRTPIFIAQLKARSLYPAVEPVEIAPFGGALTGGQTVTLSHSGGSGTIYYTLNGTDPRVPNTGAVAASALIWTGSAITPPIGPFVLKARVLNGSDWSPVTEASFTAAVAPSTGMLVISEIHYHPGVPSGEEILAGFNDADQFEFLEIVNVSTQTVALGSLRFAAGIDFDFALHSGIREIAPGAVVLIVSDAAAFAKRYGPGLPVAGVFANGTRLSNSGERIKLVTAAGLVIAEVEYNDKGDWPSAADGTGKSLTLLAPSSGFTGSDGEAWRPSTPTGGTPGILPGPLTYAEWLGDHFTPAEIQAAGLTGPLADPDGDGLANLAEYASLKNPRSLSGFPLTAVSAGSAVRFEWKRRIGASDITPVKAVIQFWDGAGGWTAAAPGAGVTMTTLPTGEGSERITIEIDRQISGLRFARLRIAL